MQANAPAARALVHRSTNSEVLGLLVRLDCAFIIVRTTCSSMPLGFGPTLAPVMGATVATAPLATPTIAGVFSAVPRGSCSCRSCCLTCSPSLPSGHSSYWLLSAFADLLVLRDHLTAAGSSLFVLSFVSVPQDVVGSAVNYQDDPCLVRTPCCQPLRRATRSCVHHRVTQ